jgi:hypothetical protein
LYDLTDIESKDIYIEPKENEKSINIKYTSILKNHGKVGFNTKGCIRDELMMLNENGGYERQHRLNLYRNLHKEEKGGIVLSGFAINDVDHRKLSAPHGFADGEFVGFMEDNSLVRIYQDKYKRQSNKPDRLWCKLDHMFVNTNITRLQSGAPDQFGYCAYDLETAKVCLSWYAITKSLNGRYPLWVNQYDIWNPIIEEKLKVEYYSLCFAFALADNRCVVTKFEKDNPIKGAKEIFVDNPMCPTNPKSFWSLFLEDPIQDGSVIALNLVHQIKEFYKYYNKNYCMGQFKYDVGLGNEYYFKFFNYVDFLTPHSGLIQIKTFADKNDKKDLLEKINRINETTKDVRNAIYNFLVDKVKYFS